MVIEMLTFTVPETERTTWLEVEERVWTRFLEQQAGFLRKEMWVSAGDRSSIHAVIWWHSLEQWKAIDSDTLAAVDQRMGLWFREPTMKVFDVIRSN